MIGRLTSKRTVLVLLVLSASVVLVSGSREWLSGSVDGSLEHGALGASALRARGSDVAQGALAAALVGLAAAVAAATAGAAVRVIAAWAAVLSAVLGSAVIIGVMADPSGALGRLAAASTGRSGTVPAHGQVGVWAWVALAATLAMGVGGLGALMGGRRWRGLSSRYDAPVADEAPRPGSSGEPAGRQKSAWDQLSRGEDPTAGQ